MFRMRAACLVMVCVVGCGARVRSDPRDGSTRLALAAVAERLGRPGEALDRLVAVERAGGPWGPRWSDADRARLGRLLYRRGRARLVRGSARALDDLLRARDRGAIVSDAEIASARAAHALAALRHVDRDQRANGRAGLASLYRALPERPGAPHPTSLYRAPSERGGAPSSDALQQPQAAGAAFGDPSWRGARSDAKPAERAAFGVWAWRHGARREAYDHLLAWRAATSPPRDADYEAYFHRAVRWWSPDTTGIANEALEADPAAIGDPPPATPAGNDARAAAAARFAFARATSIVGRNGACCGLPSDPDVMDAAGIPELAALVAIAQAFRRSPEIAARLGRELVERSVDGSISQAALGALFDALGDPARARAAWDAAATSDADPGFIAGYAEACARAGDGDAALVAATEAAAAWGDPAVVWNNVARVLLASGRTIDALTAGRSAIDLAGSELLPDALDVVIEASQQSGRTEQAAALAAERARLVPKVARDEIAAARKELAHAPTASAVDRAWQATRNEPREVDLRVALLPGLAADDPRRGVLVTELIALAADRDHVRGLRAAFALRE